MEIIKKQISSQSFSGGSMNNVTTIYFPIYLTQKFEDLGLYTDTTNPLPKTTIAFPGILDLNYDGTQQKECLITNKCQVVSTITNCTTYGGSEGSIQVTPIPTADCPGPVTYEWYGPQGFSSQNLTITNLYAGDYSLKITDANCDKTYKIFNVQEPPPLSTDLIVNNSQVNASTGICNGIATVIAVNGVPPYTYAWYSAGTTTPVLGTTTTLNNLCIGSYYVVVTDSDGAVVSTTFEITEPEPLSGRTINIINIDCNNEPGSVEVEGFGGIVGTGYTYQLLQGNPATVIQQNVTGLFENITQSNSAYIVRIIDSIGQTFDLYVSVTQPVLPITITPTGIIPFATIPVMNNDGLSLDDGDLLPFGRYSFSITGGLGIQQGASVVYDVSLEPVMVQNSVTGVYNSSANQGVDPILANSSTFYTLESGWYSVLVSDGFCEKSSNIYIGHEFDPSVGVVDASGSGGYLQAQVSNPVGYYLLSITWSDGASFACPGALMGSPCPTTNVNSNTHASGTEIDLEVIFVNSSTPTVSLDWRSFKRRYRIP